jgi:hypothetical protein
VTPATRLSPAPGSRARRLLAAAVTVAAPTVMLSACSSTDEADRLCGLVVDSTSFAAKTDVPAKVRAEVPSFLGSCDIAEFTVITGNTESSDCHYRKLQITPTEEDNPSGNPKTAANIANARKAAALKRLDEMVECAKNEKSTRTGSDVIGALADISAKTRPVDGSSRLLVISDMAHKTKELNLYNAKIGSPAEREAAVKPFTDDDALPDLTGTQVQVIGFGVGVTPDNARQRQLRDFWTWLFKETGAESASFL